MFGTKKIYCKIINGKLVVRVGGGYMGIEEFIMQYGQQEAEKYAMLHGRAEVAAATGGETSNRVKTLLKSATNQLKRTDTKTFSKDD